MKKFIDKFIFGIQYYRPPTPCSEEWKRDLLKIKDMGFNAIKIWIIWRWHEKIRKQFCWDDIDKLFNLCEKIKLWIVPNLFLESAPGWLYKKYRCWRIDNEGRAMLPGARGSWNVGGWLPCFDNPKVREEGKRFIEEVVKRYRNRDALLAWDVWNEPRSRPRGECACDSSKVKYRKWLKQKFVSLKKLNSFFGKAWGSWDEIEPPPMLEDYIEMYLWRQWAMSSVQDRVRWAYDIVKDNDSKHPIMTHGGICSILQDILNDSSDDWLNAHAVDFYGTSFPFWTGRDPAWVKLDPEIDHESSFRDKDWRYHYYLPDLISNWIKNISQYFWISEIYTGRGTWLQADFPPEDIRFWTWIAIANGAKGIFYWQYKPERLGDESGGYGLVTSTGEDTSYSYEVKDISRVLNTNAKIFRETIPSKSKIALLYDLRNDILSRVEETTPINIEQYVQYRYKEALKGIYSAFWQIGISVDWISIHNLEKLRDYKILYLPVPFIIDRNMAELLKNFVKEGGILISEASLGIREENTWMSKIIPSHGLDKVFGCTESKYFICKREEILLKKHAIKIEVSDVITYLNIDNAKVIGNWSNSMPAITINEYDKGKAIYIGTHLGRIYFHSYDRNILLFLKLLINEAGIIPEVIISGGKGLLLSKISEYRQKRLLFIFNYEDFSQEILIIQPKMVSPREITGITSIKKNSKGEISLNVPARRIVCIVAETI